MSAYVKCSVCDKAVYTKVIGFTAEGEEILGALGVSYYFGEPTNYFETGHYVSHSQVCTCTSSDKKLGEEIRLLKKQLDNNSKPSLFQRHSVRTVTCMALIFSISFALTIALRLMIG